MKPLEYTRKFVIDPETCTATITGSITISISTTITSAGFERARGLRGASVSAPAEFPRRGAR
jgi:hypothetical protein